MKIVILAGGKGSRLWPATNDEIPKQVLKLFGDQTMLEKVYKQLTSIYDIKDVYISTNDNYKKDIAKVMPEFKNYIIEPESTGTYSAILNVAMYFKSKRIKNSEKICIMPVDINVETSFFEIYKQIEEKSDINTISLIGIKPKTVSIQYGYIIHSNGLVNKFTEKPCYEKAIELIKNGALINTGIFIGSISKLSSYVSKFNVKTYKEFSNIYKNIPKGSFDKMVLEKEDNLRVYESKSNWCDIGLWENLAPIISMNDEFNTNIINFENKKIINNGIKNSIIINSKDGIKLISKSSNSDQNEWGNIETLKDDLEIKINKIFINKGNETNKMEFNKGTNLLVLNGEGVIISDVKEKKLKKGDKLEIKEGLKNYIKANDNMSLLSIEYKEVI